MSLKSKDLIIQELSIDGYEKVVKVENKKAGLLGIIAIHDTTLGPALGGIRIYPYKDFDSALEDVLRLSKGMTYKSSVSEVGFGGGKSVIIADPKKNKTRELLLAFGEAVESLNGQYICAEDVGCNVNDVMIIKEKTKYITGLPHVKSSGDPGQYTAWGIYRGIQSVLKEIYGSESVKEKKIAVQGLGNVGYHLVANLFWQGAEMVISDINTKVVNSLVKKYNVKAVDPDKIMFEECDVFAPCAMGAILNDETVHKLNCKAVAGCANNQLLHEDHGEILHKRGIVVAPDFVINAGGLINVACETEEEGYHPLKSRNKTDKIFDVLTSIYKIASQKNISTSKAAIELANKNLKNGIGKRNKKPFFHHSV